MDHNGEMMTDDEWEKQRNRAILAAFQTGRPVLADTDGVLRYANDDREPLPEDVGIAKQPIPRAIALAVRAERASRFAFVGSIVAAVGNAVAAIWQPWLLASAVVFVGSAVVWRYINRYQRADIAAQTCMRSGEESRT